MSRSPARLRGAAVVLSLLVAASVAGPAQAATLRFTGSVSTAGTVWRGHAFSTAAPGTITATLAWDTATANLDLFLLRRNADGSFTTAGQAAGTARPESLRYEAPAAGTWKLSVRARAGASSYRLDVTTPEGAPPPPPPPDGSVVDLAPTVGLAYVTRTFPSSTADYDGDGDGDILLNRHADFTSLLMRQEADGTFTVAHEFPLLDRHGCTWADYNGDGHLDVYCTRGAGKGSATKTNELWLRQPDGSWLNRASAWGVSDPYGRGRLVATLDANRDGRPDLYVTNTYPRTDGLPTPDRLFLNGGASMTELADPDVTRDGGGWCAFALDFDADGWTDLFTCATTGRRLLRNDGGTGFTDVTASRLPAAGGTRAAVGELSRDAFPDVVTVAASGLSVQLGTPAGAYPPPQRLMSLTAGWNTAVGDVDGDGDGDIYVQQGCGVASPTSSAVDRPDAILVNEGAGSWRAVGVPAPGRGCGESVLAMPYRGRTAFLVSNGYYNAPGPFQLVWMPPPASAAPPSPGLPHGVD